MIDNPPNTYITYIDASEWERYVNNRISLIQFLVEAWDDWKDIPISELLIKE